MTTKKQPAKNALTKPSAKPVAKKETAKKAAPKKVEAKIVNDAFEAVRIVEGSMVPTPNIVMTEPFTPPTPEPASTLPTPNAPKAESKPTPKKAKPEGATLKFDRTFPVAEDGTEPDTPDAILELGYADDAAIDIRAPFAFTVPAWGSTEVDTGVAIEMPSVPDFMKEHFRMACLLWAKGDLSAKSKIEVGAGLIDAGFTGNIFVHLYNNGDRDQQFKAGDRMVQMLFVPVLKIGAVQQSMSKKTTDRGSNMQGSLE